MPQHPKRSVGSCGIRKRRGCDAPSDAGAWGITPPTRPLGPEPCAFRSGALEGGAGGMRPRIKSPRARRGPVGASKGLGATALPRRAPSRAGAQSEAERRRQRAGTAGGVGGRARPKGARVSIPWRFGQIGCDFVFCDYRLLSKHVPSDHVIDLFFVEIVRHGP